jgi:hypothetical protein
MYADSAEQVAGKKKNCANTHTNKKTIIRYPTFDFFIHALPPYAIFNHTFYIYMIDIIKYYSPDNFPAIIVLLPAKML